MEASPSLDKDDENMSTTSPLALEKAVLLNLMQPKDRRIYENLTADLVFFPGLSLDEADEAKRFAGRARIVVIDKRGEHAQTLMKVGEEVQLPLISWIKKNRLEQCVIVEAEAQLAEAADAQIERDVEEIGRMLKEMAERLENESNSRDEFRSNILKVLDAYPSSAMLSAELVRQADVRQWPTWAVECLPKLYIPLETLENGHTRLLVWRYIIDCVPESYPYQITNTLCQGQFLEADAPTQTTDFLKVIAPSFEKNVQVISHADASDRHVLVAIHEAMLDIERWLEIYAPEDSEHFKEKRKEIQTKILQAR
jgi:hypothetical protein